MVTGILGIPYTSAVYRSVVISPIVSNKCAALVEEVETLEPILCFPLINVSFALADSV